MAGLLKKKKKKLTKRGRGKKNQKCLNIFSTNAAGLKNKAHSLKNGLKHLSVGVFTIQETHFRKKGTFKVEGYEIFEAIRNKQKGGTMIGIHNALNPMLIKQYDEDFELLVVEIEVAKEQIRVISGYGPQENWPESDRLPFFQALEEEINKAEMEGKSVIIEMDANSKLGPDVINGDPHPQTPNGKLLLNIIERHNLVVLNSVEDKCTGSITRRRVTKDKVEESIIDFVIVSQEMVEKVDSILIDEDREHVLVKVTKNKRGLKKQESDHNVILSKFNLGWSKNSQKKRIETFNLRNKECQLKFKEATSNTNELSIIFDNKKDLNICTKKFLKRLDGFIHESFRKIRLTENKNTEIDELFQKRKILRGKDDNVSKDELEKVEEELAKRCAEDNRRLIMEEISGIECQEGGVSSGKLWNLRKKLCPKSRDPPTAMLDANGNLVTNPEVIENIALETFRKRLENRPMKPDLENIKNDKENLCKMRLDLAAQTKTDPWTMEDLNTVLKYLKNNKSRDPSGYANELFKQETAGDDLKRAILLLMNRIKEEQIYPEALEFCNISPIYKLKNSRNDYENYRGIFRVSVFRCILDRLIYNDEYANIDSNLSDSNVEARKARNIRDNIFVVNAVMNSVVKGKEEPIDMHVYDSEKCFDALWLQECINDLFDAGLQNDKLPLLYLENCNAKVAIKSAKGISKRIDIKNIIMQ